MFEVTKMMILPRSGFLVVLSLVACSSPPASSPSTPSTTPGPAGPPAQPAPSATATSGSSPADAGATAPDASAATATADVSGTPRERLMRSHFREAALIRTAVIDGVLGDAVAPADALAKTEGLGKIEPGWQSSIDVLQYAAKRIQHGSDIPAVAAAVADIGIACGACHKAAGGPQVKVDSPPPPADSSITSRMRRHVWATERLWEGIFVPSDASWKVGAEALSGEPFPKEVLDRGGVHARSAAGRFKTLVAGASSKRTPAERGQLYASLLETCAACHVVARKK